MQVPLLKAAALALAVRMIVYYAPATAEFLLYFFDWKVLCTLVNY